MQPVPHTIGRTRASARTSRSSGPATSCGREESGGAFALIEHTIPPRVAAAPMHVHEREDEFPSSSRAGSAHRSATTSSRPDRVSSC